MSLSDCCSHTFLSVPLIANTTRLSQRNPVLERERLLPKVAAILENAALMQPTNVVRFGPAHLDAFLQEVLPPPFTDALEVAWRPGEALGGRGECGPICVAWCCMPCTSNLDELL